MTLSVTRRTLAVAAAFTTLTLSACSNSLTGVPATQETGAALPEVQVNQALHDKLPEKIKSSGSIVIGTAPNYKPVEFLEGGEVAGVDIELFNAVAKRLGVTPKWEQSAFDQILIGIKATKYDVGVSAFTVNAERTKNYDMVSYMSAGSQWIAAKGNPKKVVQGKPCGLTVAVQTGTVQDDEMKAAQKSCGDKKINILSFTDQGEATAALVSGRADAVVADSPIALYAVQMNEAALEPVGDPYDAAPYGVVVRKTDEGLAEVIAQAFAEVKESGHYEATLTKWNQKAGAVAEFKVNS